MSASTAEGEASAKESASDSMEEMKAWPKVATAGFEPKERKRDSTSATRLPVGGACGREGNVSCGGDRVGCGE